MDVETRIIHTLGLCVIGVFCRYFTQFDYKKEYNINLSAASVIYVVLDITFCFAFSYT